MTRNYTNIEQYEKEILRLCEYGFIGRQIQKN